MKLFNLHILSFVTAAAASSFSHFTHVFCSLAPLLSAQLLSMRGCCKESEFAVKQSGFAVKEKGVCREGKVILP